MRRCSRCYSSAVDCDGLATCNWSRLTALLLGRLLEVLLLTEACSMGRAVHWSPKKPESVDPAGPTEVFADLLLSLLYFDLQNVPWELHCSSATCWLVRVVSWLSQSHITTDGQSVLKRLPAYLCWCLETDPSVDTDGNNHVLLGYHGNSVYRAIAWIPIWETCGRFPWKVPI
jgi:hypothetical protein